MRWLRWPISTAIVLLLPVWILLLIPKFNGFGPDVLKHQLKQQQTYTQLSAILHQNYAQDAPIQPEVTDQALVVLRSALTPDYIEKKSNKAIDDTAAWMTRQTETQPRLDLNDIKNSVLTIYPDAQVQIDQLKADFAEARDKIDTQPMPVDGIEGLESDGSASTDEIAKLLQQTDSLNNFVAGDFSVNLGPTLQPLYQAYQFYQIAVPVLGIIIAVLLSVFIISTTSWQNRLKNLGWLLISFALINGVLVALFALLVLKIGLNAAVAMLPAQAEVVGSIGRAVIESFYANYIPIEAGITLSVLIIGLLMLLLPPIIIKKRLHTSNAPAPIHAEADKNHPPLSITSADKI